MYLQDLGTICLECWVSVGLCISPSSYPQSWGRSALHHGMVACILQRYLCGPKQNTFINHNLNSQNVNYTYYHQLAQIFCVCVGQFRFIRTANSTVYSTVLPFTLQGAIGINFRRGIWRSSTSSHYIIVMTASK